METLEVLEHCNSVYPENWSLLILSGSDQKTIHGNKSSFFIYHAAKHIDLQMFKRILRFNQFVS